MVNETNDKHCRIIKQKKGEGGCAATEHTDAAELGGAASSAGDVLADAGVPRGARCERGAGGCRVKRG